MGQWEIIFTQTNNSLQLSNWISENTQRSNHGLKSQKSSSVSNNVKTNKTVLQRNISLLACLKIILRNYLRDWTHDREDHLGEQELRGWTWSMSVQTADTDIIDNEFIAGDELEQSCDD